jgi:capsular polysaccharide biosynthesis protein
VSRPRKISLGAIAGVLFTVLILASGLFWVFSRSHTWAAKAVVVVLPAPGIPSGTAASYYDTLSRGQIVETYAEILRLQRFQEATIAGLDRATAQPAKTTVTVAVVPNTALITITATGPSRTVAETLADGVFTQAGNYVRSLAGPYTVTAVSTAKGTGTQSTSHTSGFLAVLVVVALVVGLGVQQAVSQLVNARGKVVSAAPSQVSPIAVAATPPPPTGAAPTAQPPPAPAPPTTPKVSIAPRWPPAHSGGNGSSETGRVDERTPEP